MTYQTKTKEQEDAELIEGHLQYYYHDTGDTYDSSDEDWTKQAGYQRITTETRKRSDPATRNVTHRVRYGGHVPCTFNYLNVFWPVSASRLIDWRLDPDESNFTYGYKLSSLLADPEDADVAAFSAQAFQAMRPSLEGDLSLTNALLELRELPSLLKVFPQWIDRVRTLRDVSKVSSGFHLTYAFGIKPLVQDIRSLYDSLFNIEETLKDYVKRQNTLNVRHFGYTSDPVVCKEFQTTSLKYDTQYEIDLNYVDSWHATMKYRYFVPDLSKWYNKIRAYREVLGLKLEASKFWDAGPWTFLLDWLVDVGGFLEQFDGNALPVNLEIVDYGVSFKRILHHTKLRANFPAIGGGRVVYTCYQGKGKLYWRRRFAPDTRSFTLDVSGLSINQLVLSASLLNLKTK